MPDSFQYDVFLSHNHADKPRVRRLAAQLKAAGVQAWLDERNVAPGDLIALKWMRGRNTRGCCCHGALPDTLRRYKNVDYDIKCRLSRGEEA